MVFVLCQDIFSLLSVLGMLTYLSKLKKQRVHFCVPEISI